MRSETWAALCAFSAAVWHRPIGAAEQAAGMKLLGGLPDEAVERALELLAESGRDTLPSWSLVYKTAADLRATTQPALADPDLTRDPTPEERERFKRRWPQLQQQLRELAARRAL